MTDQLAKFSEQMVDSVKAFLQRNLVAVLARVKVLEDRPIPLQGERGEPGPQGPQGIQGDKGVEGQAGAKGEQGPSGLLGPQGLPGAKGDAGLVGKDGAPGGEGPQGIIGPRGDPGPAGLVGKDGAPGGEGPQGPKGDKGDAGLVGKDGSPGKDADPLVVAALVAKAVGEIPKPADGRDGRDGEQGRDAFAIEVLPDIDSARRYQRGTWARHKGGVWMARAPTNGMEGWECVVDGVAAAECVQDAADPRKFAMGLKLSSGTIIERDFRIPVTIYKGIWRDDAAYERGDATTRDGNTWILMADEQKSKPGDADSGWQLSVKRGTAGRDGLKGATGDRGAEGRAGLDLTSMAADGTRYR